MATGNGAHVIHSILSEKLAGYVLKGYNPYLTLVPPILSLLYKKYQNVDLIHTTPDYACFFHKYTIPLVITFHNYVLDSFMLNHSNLFQKNHYKTDLKWFTRKALQKAHTVTSVSKYTASLVKNDLNYNGEI